MQIVLLALLSVMLMSCAKKNTEDFTHNILKPCPSFTETGKPALVYGAECGELLVKENPADPQSRDIAIHILRLPAISPSEKPDPLVLIQGGPGASSIDMAKLVHTSFAEVRKTRDLIFIDQRGTGASSPMPCETLAESDEFLPESAQASKTLQLARQCAEKYRQHIPFYTTPYAVQDINAVRIALGYEKINLWGVSYGTRVALEYMRLFPEQVRSVILDGVAPVQIALPKFFQADALVALQSVNQECNAQSACKNLYGDMLENVNKVSQRLISAQHAGQAIQLEFEHPRNQKITKLVLTPKRFASVIFMSLYSRDLTALLPHAIANAALGDYRLIASLSALASEQSGLTNISEGMRYTIICNEDAQFISAQDIAEATDFFGMNMLKDIANVCAVWPKVALPDYYHQPMISNLPTLLLSGHHDPVTPAHWAAMVANNLPNSLQVTAPGGNHSVSMEGCLPTIIAKFIDSALVDNINTDCVNNIVTLPLVLGANEDPASSSSSAASHSAISTGALP